ncbi:hypothetical protein [Clostridium sp. JN-1]|uniref:hypothetical protein n=1 Tax=Clostridium sp. JN-1 TaxID=2483110 RepID=UPI000F0B2152|nr:hypothetical protein [Clostridium sp. JN-1]
MINKGTLIEVESSIGKSVMMHSRIYVIGKSLSNCEIGDIVDVKTISGHIVRGVAYRTKSYYGAHQKNVKEILCIRQKRK